MLSCYWKEDERGKRCIKIGRRRKQEERHTQSEEGDKRKERRETERKRERREKQRNTDRENPRDYRFFCLLLSSSPVFPSSPHTLLSQTREKRMHFDFLPFLPHSPSCPPPSDPSPSLCPQRPLPSTPPLLPQHTCTLQVFLVPRNVLTSWTSGCSVISSSAIVEFFFSRK